MNSTTSHVVYYPRCLAFFTPAMKCAIAQDITHQLYYFLTYMIFIMVYKLTLILYLNNIIKPVKLVEPFKLGLIFS